MRSTVRECIPIPQEESSSQEDKNLTQESEMKNELLLAEIERLRRRLAEVETPIEEKMEESGQLCMICHDTVELPSTINAKSGKKCEASQNNPYCLFCIRQYMTDFKRRCGYSERNYNRTSFKCPTRCCELDISWGCFLYGESGRKRSQVAEPSMWKQLGKNGVTKCRRCDEELPDVYSLGLHVKNECKKRKIWCFLCKKTIECEEMQNHRMKCYTFCRWCDEKVTVDKYKNFGEKHKCKKVTVGKCFVCKVEYNEQEREQHQNCSHDNIQLSDVLYTNNSAESNFRLFPPINGGTLEANTGRYRNKYSFASRARVHRSLYG